MWNVADAGFSGDDLPISWIVGDTYLKNFYSVFRYDPPAVGFAPLAQSTLCKPTVSIPSQSCL